MAEPIDRKHIDDDVVYKTLFQKPEDDTISRQGAIDIERNATIDTNPTHFEAHQKFIQFMDDVEISSFGRWQWSNGFNTALTAIGIELKKLPSAQPDLDEWCTDCKEYDQEKHCCPRWNRVIRNALKDAQPEPRWIPIEERPPEFGKEVLISHKGAVSIDWLTQSEGWAYFFVSGAAIADIDAWMPLPKPYERSEE